ncbi:MAG: twin-arginine translocase subunit TatB [Rhizobiales bacterium]|nr:twin-arginine translocase subunit TatB [Hyphomicrobiales bacterium]
MFDLGWTELLLVAVVAIIFVGPKDLPKLMRTAGQYTARMRKMVREFQTSFEDLARESELEDLRKEMAELRSQTMAPISMGGVDAAMAKASGLKPPKAAEPEKTETAGLSAEETARLEELPEAMQETIRDASDPGETAESDSPAPATPSKPDAGQA